MTNSTLTRATLQVEIPLSPFSRKRLGVEKEICRLILSLPNDPTNGTQSLSRFVWGDSKKRSVLTAIGEFSSVHDIELSNVGDHRIAFISSAEQLAEILLNWPAEMHVLLNIKEEAVSDYFARVDKVVSKWWRVTADDVQAPFIEQIDDDTEIFFFSMSYRSVEVYGRFDVVRDMSKRALNEWYAT